MQLQWDWLDHWHWSRTRQSWTRLHLNLLHHRRLRRIHGHVCLGRNGSMATPGVRIYRREYFWCKTRMTLIWFSLLELMNSAVCRQVL